MTTKPRVNTRGLIALHSLAGRGLPGWWLMVMVMLAGAGVRPLRGAEATDEQIVTAIKQQVDYLLSQRTAEKNWEVQKAFANWAFEPTGGETALTLYSLLYAGRCIDDERLSPKSAELKPALQWLAKVRPTATYAAGLQATALALVPDVQRIPEYRAALARDREYMLAGMARDGGYSYGWDWRTAQAPMYADGKITKAWDNSNCQYGLLGAWACWDAGTEFPLDYWNIANEHWRKTQQGSGAWPYSAGGKDTLAMTAAGVASLYITTDCVDVGALRLEGRVDTNIDTGMAWITQNFNPGAGLYALYGCERVGLASGRKFFGTTDWYKAGAASILAAQAPDGHNGLGVLSSGPPISTAYALLFLCRGRNPVLFNKLEYHDARNPGHLYWNARPRDLANLAHEAGRKFEKDFNWHVVNLQVSPEEWRDAPVLLITGSRDPNFTPEDVAKLKTFINDGGIIFSTADGATPAFTTAMRKYAAQVVDNKYEMRELPRDHALFTLQFHIAKPLKLLATSNGVREVWIHSPGDLGASWQQRTYTRPDDWDMPANLYLYATGKYNSRAKIQDLTVKPGTAAAVRTINLARIDYPGNWDPEPGAWPRMVKLAQAQFKTDLKISNVKLSELDAKQTPVAHMTGTAAFTLGGDDIGALRRYLNGGGTLIADAAGGSDAFTDSFAKLSKQLFPGEALDQLPGDHPVISGSMPDGGSVSDVDYRRNTLKKHGQPPLWGLKHQGRWVVVLSPMDFTSGLLGTRTWGIVGYSPESSQAIARNLLLWAQTPTVVAQPSPGPTAPEAGGTPIPTINLPSLK
jgi:hypothetical protein